MNAFLAALKNNATKVEIKPATAPISNASVAPINPPEPSVTIDRVLTANRIDLFFSSKPSDKAISDLKDHGFRWNPVRRCWYHRDCYDTQLFLELRYNATFLNAPESPPLNSNSSDIVTPRGQSTIVVPDQADKFEDEPEEGTEEYKHFKMQVRALQAELKIDAADLMLRAIATLYADVFKPQ